MRLFGTGSFIDMREKKLHVCGPFFSIKMSHCFHPCMEGFIPTCTPLNPPIYSTPSSGGNNKSHPQGGLLTLLHCNKLLLSQCDGGVKVIPVWQDRKFFHVHGCACVQTEVPSCIAVSVSQVRDSPEARRVLQTLLEVQLDRHLDSL